MCPNNNKTHQSSENKVNTEKSSTHSEKISSAPSKSQTKTNVTSVRNFINSEDNSEIPVKKPVKASVSRKCNLPALPVCIVMILFMISEKIMTNGTLANSDPYIALVILQFFVFIIPCAFFSAIANHRINSGLSQYNLRLFSPKLLGFTIFSFFALIFGTMTLKYLGYLMFGAVNSSTVVYADDNIFSLIAATVIVPAIAEEILLRGVVFTEYEKGVGPLGAIIGSSFLFAFIHFDISNFIPYLFAGIILSTTLHVSRSLLMPILIHLLNNTVCLFTDAFLKRVSKESISSFFVLFILVVLFLITLFFWLESLEWICNSKAEKANKKKTADTTEVSKLIPIGYKLSSALSSILFAPAFIIAFILYIIKVFFLT